MAKIQVHRIVLLVVDHDGLGSEEASEILENNRYPNHCMYPRVIGVETAEVEWSDEHPLNRSGDITQAIVDTFGAK